MAITEALRYSPATDPAGRDELILKLINEGYAVREVLAASSRPYLNMRHGSDKFGDWTVKNGQYVCWSKRRECVDILDEEEFRKFYEEVEE
jgi:hypothetical protein